MNMGRILKIRRRGVTLIEVMVAALVVLVVVVGAMAYQAACAINARKADASATASRLGLLVLEGWKSAGANITAFNPTDDQFDLNLPNQINTTSVGLGGVGTELGRYEIAVNGVTYYMTLIYSADYVYPPPPGAPPAMLTVLTAWNRDDFMAGELGEYPESVRLSTYAID